jgi:hypothetical protein
MSTAITLEQAQAQLAAMLAAQSAGNLRSITINGRTTTFATTAEFLEQLNYWVRMVTEFQRRAAGRSRHGYAGASFRSPQ